MKPKKKSAKKLEKPKNQKVIPVVSVVYDFFVGIKYRWFKKFIVFSICKKTKTSSKEIKSGGVRISNIHDKKDIILEGELSIPRGQKEAEVMYKVIQLCDLLNGKKITDF